MVEVGLISKFIQALSNATVSASVLITGMLVFSGLGSFVSERYFDRARTIMPRIFLAIGLLLIGYGVALDRILDWIGTLPYLLRLLFCFVLIFPPAFLMGFPMPVAMVGSGKEHRKEAEDRQQIGAAADHQHGKAWVDDPLRAVLAKVPGFPRTRAAPPPSRKR